jgi:hypothetical protein
MPADFDLGDGRAVISSAYPASARPATMIVVGTAPFTDDMLLPFVVTGASPAVHAPWTEAYVLRCSSWWPRWPAIPPGPQHRSPRAPEVPKSTRRPGRGQPQQRRARSRSRQSDQAHLAEPVAAHVLHVNLPARNQVLVASRCQILLKAGFGQEVLLSPTASMRHSFNGSTSAFQADHAGSIPVARSLVLPQVSGRSAGRLAIRLP